MSDANARFASGTSDYEAVSRTAVGGPSGLRTHVSWETCEVIHEQVRPGIWSSAMQFTADAVGPGGRYQAGSSPEFKVDSAFALEDPKARSMVQGADAALGALVSALVRDGWEPLETRGQYWYSHRLRRQAAPFTLDVGQAAPLRTVPAGLPQAVGATPPLPVPPQAATATRPLPESPRARKSARVAVLLWLLTGLVGGHRYYLGRPGTGLLQTITLGGFGVWWLIDVLLLPGMLREANGER